MDVGFPWSPIFVVDIVAEDDCHMDNENIAIAKKNWDKAKADGNDFRIKKWRSIYALGRWIWPLIAERGMRLIQTEGFEETVARALDNLGIDGRILAQGPPPSEQFYTSRVMWLGRAQRPRIAVRIARETGGWVRFRCEYRRLVGVYRAGYDAVHPHRWIEGALDNYNNASSGWAVMASGRDVIKAVVELLRKHGMEAACDDRNWNQCASAAFQSDLAPLRQSNEFEVFSIGDHEKSWFIGFPVTRLEDNGVQYSHRAFGNPAGSSNQITDEFEDFNSEYLGDCDDPDEPEEEMHRELQEYEGDLAQDLTDAMQEVENNEEEGWPYDDRGS